MKPVFTVAAPAKLNLHLDITGMRPDGFHSLVSIFHAVDLEDELRFYRVPGEAGSEVSGGFDCPPEDNLIIKAVNLFGKTLGRGESFRIEAVKKIPAGAGLGGGSSDAAAVLKGLNGYYGGPLTQRELLRLGESLGSDVPFFLGESTASLVTGRGEVLRDLPPLKGYAGILAVPPVAVATPRAFGLFDREGGVSGLMDQGEIRRVYEGLGAAPWPFYNSFTRSLISHYPVIKEILDYFAGLNPLYRGISGSGSSVFAIFPEKFPTEEAIKGLKSRFDRVWKIKLLAQWKSPY